MKPDQSKQFSLTVYLFIVIQLFTTASCQAQSKKEMRVAFWNFENFFDPFVDSTKTYNDFTENGEQHWTMSRFYKKRNNMYKAILSLSGGKPIAILGICEVENDFVLNMLFNQTPLKTHNYRCVHYESPDRRGIDVALAYCIDQLQLVSSRAIPLQDSKNKGFKSRDVLYVKFTDRQGDTLHCFVNHWPSRYGGERETIALRGIAAKLLRSKVDSILNVTHDKAKIIIMGDFNDTPDDPSIINILKAKSLQKCKETRDLVNLFVDGKALGFEGTLKHEYHWQIFDQIIVSKSLLNADNQWKYKDSSASIFHQDFLFKKDETYGGVKLFRTYIGPKYYGGFSDHLPIYIDLQRSD